MAKFSCLEKDTISLEDEDESCSKQDFDLSDINDYFDKNGSINQSLKPDSKLDMAFIKDSHSSLAV